MGKPRLSSSGSFDTDDLRLLSSVYDDVCQSLAADEKVLVTPQVRETIAAAIFGQAAKGERCPGRLRSRALREVEAYDGVKRASGQTPSEVLLGFRI